MIYQIDKTQVLTVLEEGFVNDATVGVAQIGRENMRDRISKTNNYLTDEIKLAKLTPRSTGVVYGQKAGLSAPIVGGAVLGALTGGQVDDGEDDSYDGTGALVGSALDLAALSSKPIKNKVETTGINRGLDLGNRYAEKHNIAL